MIDKIIRIFLFLKAKRKERRFRKLAIMGNDVQIGHNANIFVEPGGKVVIGNHAFIGGIIQANSGAEIIIGDYFSFRGGRIGAQKSLRIGHHVVISSNIFVVDNNNHPISEIKRQEMCEYGFFGDSWHWRHSKSAPIIIGNNVWIGQGVTILKGVTIGDGSIIAQQSVVTKDIPPHTIAAGNPARIVKEIPIDERLPD